MKITFDIRLTAEQALGHSYLADYSDPSDEPASGMMNCFINTYLIVLTCGIIVELLLTFISLTDPFDDSFEEQNLSVMEWKSIFII